MRRLSHFSAEPCSEADLPAFDEIEFSTGV